MWPYTFLYKQKYYIVAKSISLNLYLQERKVTEDCLPREKENLGTSKSSGTLPRKCAITSHPFSCRLGILGYDDPTPLPLRFILGVLGLGPLVWVPTVNDYAGFNEQFLELQSIEMDLRVHSKLPTFIQIEYWAKSYSFMCICVFQIALIVF